MAHSVPGLQAVPGGLSWETFFGAAANQQWVQWEQDCLDGHFYNFHFFVCFCDISSKVKPNLTSQYSFYKE